MKKMVYSLLAVGLLCVVGFAGVQRSQAASETELRPMQKAMQARAAWVKAITANLDTMKYAEVKKDATDLAAQASTMAEKNPNPLAKELTLKLSTQATALADAAGKKDGGTAKSKLAQVNATCGECHAKIRDKK